MFRVLIPTLIFLFGMKVYAQGGAAGAVFAAQSVQNNLAQNSCNQTPYGYWDIVSNSCRILDNIDACDEVGGEWVGGCINMGSRSRGSNNSNGVLSLGQQCEADTQKAVRDCNFEGNSGVQDVMGMAGQLQNAFQQMAAANPQLACSKLGQLSGAASAASAAFNGGCSLAYNKCQTTCASELEQAQASTNPSAAAAVENIRRQQRQCQSLASSLNQSVNNIGQFAQMSQSMAYCQSQTGDSWAEYCQKNPADPFCRTAQKTTDCSDPTTAATNTVCICQRNPNDPKCGASNQTNFASKAGTDGTANLDDVGGLPDLGSGGGISDPGIAVPNQPAQGNLNLGSAGSKGVGVSGGGNSGGRGGAAGGTAGSGLNTKVIGGYGVGGRGGSGFSAGSGGGGGTQGGSYAMNAGGRAGAPGVDLKQFLPGGQRDPSRGLAGVSGPDGITGPHSSIWKKVNSRYMSVSPSLLP